MKNGATNKDPSGKRLTRSPANCLLVMFPDDSPGSDGGIGVCGWLLFGMSWLMVAITLPFSLCVLLKVGAPPSPLQLPPDHYYGGGIKMKQFVCPIPHQYNYLL